MDCAAGSVSRRCAELNGKAIWEDSAVLIWGIASDLQSKSVQPFPLVQLTDPACKELGYTRIGGKNGHEGVHLTQFLAHGSQAFSQSGVLLCHLIRSPACHCPDAFLVCQSLPVDVPVGHIGTVAPTVPVAECRTGEEWRVVSGTAVPHQMRMYPFPNCLVSDSIQYLAKPLVGNRE